MSKNANIKKLMAEFDKMYAMGRWPAKEASDHALRAHREFTGLVTGDSNLSTGPWSEDIRDAKLERMRLNILQARTALELLLEQINNALGY